MTSINHADELYSHKVHIAILLTETTNIRTAFIYWNSNGFSAWYMKRWH